MSSLFIGLGSNLNNPFAQLQTALQKIQQVAGFQLKKYSSFYQSPPMAGMKQPDYINAVCLVETELSPLQCLDRLQAIEQQMGRVRGKQHWQARTLDLDILLYDLLKYSDKRLTIPHYGMLERSFVIKPLLEIAPEVQHPDFGLLKMLDQSRFNETAKKISWNNNALSIKQSGMS